jgi:CHAT domain-containing protein
VQKLIPPEAALVEFAVYRPVSPKMLEFAGSKSFDAKLVGKPRYAVFVATRRGNVQWKDLGETEEIDKVIEAFRTALRDPKRADVQKYARAVSDKILLPIRPFFGSATRLLISPDGVLNLIPFEALQDENSKYLVETYSISYLTSGRELLRMQVRRESKSEMLLLANPFFGAASAEKFFAPLGGTEQEARAIQNLFPSADLLTGKQATETVLKQTAAPQILHLATHGFFTENISKVENPLMRSGLALAGANARKSAVDDGILTALEASGLNLWGTKLVVMSACDTGLGEVRNGEGVFGLRRAFVLAGTESLVMSLWAVSDYATRELMTNYYKNLKQGMGRGESLRGVQLEMLKNPNRQHPFYWASFIQSGDWAGLESKK